MGSVPGTVPALAEEPCGLLADSTEKTTEMTPKHTPISKKMKVQIFGGLSKQKSLYFQGILSSS
jgi:hypothetical protein